ncbi:hypothetical protein PQR70_28175 [Paraburkholderia madseniana]|uniref:Uncharacterized protein n=1 Tax=Paraburkholderia madseniana TaxID=2599607 RepID=A0AAP5EQG4_9BURK|nr:MULTISPECIES: hypothetical protein [Paraburkholderia]MCX4147882.1 hypothetical protein [Paraburkholderia madseniana]MDN7150824.1 hypothetical protein [Paraburkholderia sp. WS6]MDQ6409704.1 hypothetical protein [Paraburkholderia madseniana]
MLAVFCRLCQSAFAQSADNAASLRNRYRSLTQQLAHNQFQRPLHLESQELPSALKGDIYGVVNYPFATVNGTLNEPTQGPANWCDVLILIQEQLRIAQRLSGWDLMGHCWVKILILTRNLPAGRYGCLSRRFEASDPLRSSIFERSESVVGPLGGGVPIDGEYATRRGSAKTIFFRHPHIDSISRHGIASPPAFRRGCGDPAFWPRGSTAWHGSAAAESVHHASGGIAGH